MGGNGNPGAISILIIAALAGALPAGCGCGSTGLHGDPDAADTLGDSPEEEVSSPPSCGNGALEAGEECDDGNDVRWDGCNDCGIVEFQVNTHTPDIQHLPSVHVAADGSFTVIWSSLHQDGDYWGVFGQMYDDEGNRIGTEFRINDQAEGDQNFADLAGYNDGRFVVVWTDYVLDRIPRYSIHGRVFDSSGSPVTSDIPINTDSTFTGHHASVAMSASGSFVVAWVGGEASGVLGRRYSYDGTALGPAFQVNTLSDSVASPTVTMNADGGFVVVWPSEDHESDDQAYHARRYLPSGDAIGDEFLISPHSGVRTIWHDASMSAEGRFVVAWAESEPASEYGDVFGQLFDASGEFVGPAFAVSTDGGFTREKPAASMNQHGSIVFAWHGFGSRSDDDITIRLFDESGTPLGSERVTHTYVADDQQHADVSFLPDGRHIVVWQSEGQDGELAGIFAQRFDASGTPLGTLPW